MLLKLLTPQGRPLLLRVEFSHSILEQMDQPTTPTPPRQSPLEPPPRVRPCRLEKPTPPRPALTDLKVPQDPIVTTPLNPDIDPRYLRRIPVEQARDQLSVCNDPPNPTWGHLPGARAGLSECFVRTGPASNLSLRAPTSPAITPACCYLWGYLLWLEQLPVRGHLRHQLARLHLDILNQSGHAQINRAAETGFGPLRSLNYWRMLGQEPAACGGGPIAKH
ncbi:hypothetical protein DFP72DRAFT_862123 [Ephemerocybe angulata]|uniref:Uncharacterized protein n=1 Tax=Ephemerocybe angulata TaxID=980116 RepID=A0A8H6LUE5_9AGAR|nr:hypothetical protein DFP72DRAFT_862123 [Tulosesus angulatus]